MSDVFALEKYQSNTSYLEHYEVQPDAKEIVTAACTWADEAPRRNYQLAICLKQPAELVGSVGIRSIDYPAHEAEFGIEVNPNHWRKGIASEASLEMMSFAKAIGIIKLHAVTNGSNSRSQELLRKLGFRRQEEQGSDVRYSKSLIQS